MYTNVWSKYLPIIKILLKKSRTAQQTLTLNLSDFERAGIARKSGYKFSIVLRKGKVDNVIINSPLASNLASALLGDDAIKALVSHEDFQIDMNTKFQLVIKHLGDGENNTREAEIRSTETEKTSG